MPKLFELSSYLEKQRPQVAQSALTDLGTTRIQSNMLVLANEMQGIIGASNSATRNVTVLVPEE